MPQVQSRLHPVVTLDMAIKDKSYSLIDVALVVEEAFDIDSRTCAELLVLHMPSRMVSTLMNNPPAQREFLELLFEHQPVL